MYRIHVLESGVVEDRQMPTELAEQQTMDLLKTVTRADYGNFDAQTHEQHVAFVEEVVIGALRNQYAATSPTGPKARERHYATLEPKILNIARFVQGMTYEEIAAESETTADEVQQQVMGTMLQLSSGSLYGPSYFSAAYRQRHSQFRRSKYTGLLGIVKFAEGAKLTDEVISPIEVEESRPTTFRSAKSESQVILDDSVALYLRNIAKTPLLKAAQEVALAKRIESGLIASNVLSRYKRDLSEIETEELGWLVSDGNVAYEAFYAANLRLVVSIAKKYREQGAMTFADIIQEGNTGLQRAVQKFDYARGYKFSTYATPWIKQSITRSLANSASVIRKPVHTAEAIRALWSAERKLEGQGVELSAENLAQEMDCSVDRIYDLFDWRREPISYDTPLDSGKRFSEGTLLIDMIADKEFIQQAPTSADHEKRQRLLELVQQLDGRSADVLLSRFGVSTGRVESYEDIAARYGLSGERVRQLESAALSHLRTQTALADAV